MRRTRRFLSHWQNVLGLFLVFTYVVMALLAPVLSPQDPKQPGPFLVLGRGNDRQPHPPDDVNRLGTLPGQFDVFHTILWGSRAALQFSLVVAVSAAIFGIVFGAVSGYAGGIVNSIMMRISDAFLAFPPIVGVVFINQIMAITITSMGGYFSQGAIYGLENYTGPKSPIQFLVESIDPLMLSLILFSWMPYSRLINAMVASLKNTEYIQAARVLGATPFRIIFRHLIPNTITPAVVLAARDVGNVVILQATLTFIRIGGNSPWGALLYMGRNWVIGPQGNLFVHWWTFVPATLAIAIFGIAWNLLGDGLNEALDPHST